MICESNKLQLRGALLIDFCDPHFLALVCRSLSSLRRDGELRMASTQHRAEAQLCCVPSGASDDRCRAPAFKVILIFHCFTAGFFFSRVSWCVIFLERSDIYSSGRLYYPISFFAIRFGQRIILLSVSLRCPYVPSDSYERTHHSDRSIRFVSTCIPLCPYITYTYLYILQEDI